MPSFRCLPLGLLCVALPVLCQVNDGAKFSPARQINKTNVANLAVAWTFHSEDMHKGERGGLRGKASAFESTALYSEGTLYLTTAFGRVIALDPDTGLKRWAFDPHVDVNAGYGDFANRGVSEWRDPKTGRRTLFIGTIDGRLIAVDAANGAQKFSVDLKQGLRLPVLHPWEFEETSAPAVINDLVIVGSAIADNDRTDAPSGEVRAWDARTGKLRWTFDPMPGTKTGAANAWSGITPDSSTGLVFIPTGSPSPDYFGGMRPGDNQHANSVVAVEAKTGKVRWAFQTVHHDLWDYDVAAQPALIMAKGRKAVAVASKTGYVFILDRLTGKPVFGVDEAPAPKSDVPGEQAAATQPVPRLPAHLGPKEMQVWGPTEEDRAWCAGVVGSLRSEGMFTPPSLQGSLLFPGNVGGVAWGGMAFDAADSTLFVPYNKLAAVARLVPRDDLGKAMKERPAWEVGSQKGTPFAVQRTFLLSPKGIPCTAPPWGMIAAINANTGALKWEVAAGSLPAPASPEWGSPVLGGPIVTAGGLLFMGGSFDPFLKAYDTATGKLLWRGPLPTSARATPMTFTSPKGKQFIVIAAGGHDFPGMDLGDSLVAFALP